MELGDPGRNPPADSVNLAQLRADSLRVTIWFPMLLAYVWFAGLVWPEAGRAPTAAWIGTIVLIVGTSVSYRLRSSRAAFASLILVLSILCGAAAAMLAYRAVGYAYLLVLGIVFASVLLGPTAALLAAGASAVLVAVVGVRAFGLPLLDTDITLPFLVLLLVGFASWLSARNLYTALAWVWHGYERALHNEEMARARGAELRQALKALDEATHRLERTNYMLALARDQAEDARRLKQQFAQTISHELRTPLNLIVGFTELMAGSPEYYGGQLSPAYVRDLAIVHRNSRHLQTLINDVLDLARIESAQMSVITEATDPVTLVREAVNTARSLVESRGLALHTDIEPGLPLLKMDPTRIRQVLFNLINNAARFTERGSVTVRLCRESDVLVFSVTDTGVGIAQEDLPRVFHEFQQLDGSTRRRHEGAGLGLAISRSFVELHGGRIRVESVLGRGSTFSFTLPVESPDAEEAAALPAVPASVMPARRDVENERVLLAVTPSPSAAGLLGRYVRASRTVVVQDLEQARRVAQSVVPQAVVIDRAYEDLLDVDAGSLACAWGLKDVPFMFCPLPGEEALRKRLHVDGYLTKPVSRESLWDMLRQFGDGVDRVLVIDDDRDFVRLLGRLLDNPVRRYQVSAAHTAREGLEMLRRRTPDLLLLDMVLPDLSGDEVVRRVRATPAWGKLPIVVISAQDEIDNAKELAGDVTITKAEGLMPAEVILWVQSLLDMASRRPLWAASETPPNRDSGGSEGTQRR
ncbi:MAG: ATP-binding response regulator [Anaerolineae bacterium]